MPKNWLLAFSELSQAMDALYPNERKVLFLDELPWMATPRSGFLAALGWLWNSWATKRNVVVVICGSAASWMIRRVINHRGGLHNRITRMMLLLPFTLAEMEFYCRTRQITLDRYQLLQLYMVLGGIPLYLDLLKPGLSATQNIERICFERGAYLRSEFDRLFASLFDRYERHLQVVRALASVRRGLTRNELKARLTLSDGGGLSRLLDELEASGFITIYGSYRKKKQFQLYRLTDGYSHFYLSFLEKITRNAKVEFTGLTNLPQWRTWAGYAFENVCLEHISQIRRALGINGISSQTATFIARPKDGLPGAQIDLLIDRQDRNINLCEMKFSVREIQLTKAMVEHLRTERLVFAHHTKTKKHVFLTLVTIYGVKNDDHINHGIDQVITMDDLFQP